MCSSGADREVLARLGHHAFVGRDHQHRQIDAADAGQHVLDEALVAGNVDDLDGEAVRLLEEREAEVDRDAARLLLGQAVGVDAGQRLHERGLAVVDVPGGADDDVRGVAHARRRPPRAPAPARVTCAGQHRPAVEEEPVVGDAADDRRIARRAAPRRAHRGPPRVVPTATRRGRAAPRSAARRRRPASDRRRARAPSRSPHRRRRAAAARAAARLRCCGSGSVRHRERRHRLERRSRLVGVRASPRARRS